MYGANECDNAVAAMHELSVALNMIDLAIREVPQCQARIVAIHVKVGPLSGVVPDALKSAFELARTDTPLADCRLVIEETAITISCATCGGDRPAKSLQSLRCRDCDSPAAQVVAGGELELTALEIEE